MSSSSLNDNLNSFFLEAYASLLPKSSPKKITVYVESHEDISFWRNIVDQFETSQIKFDVLLPSSTSLTKGKEKALERTNEIFETVPINTLGNYIIICIDSDYDYLLPKRSDTSRKIKENPYIFQTYAYSIENLKCYSSSLHSLCVTITANDEKKIDFEKLLELYSDIVYELFVWNLYFYSRNEVETFTLSSFCETIKILENPIINEFGKTSLQKVKARVDEKLSELKKQFPQNISEVQDFKNTLTDNFGLNNKNAYLFIQGHTIFNNVVLMFLKPLCRLLKAERIEQIKSHAQHDTERNNNINQYNNLIGKTDNTAITILSNNTNFRNCFLYSKIESDFTAFIAKIV